MRYFHLFAIAALPLIAVCAADTPAAGTAKFEFRSDSSFDKYTNNSSTATKAWMTSKLWRFQTCAPYFDEGLSWMPNSWTYVDSYAIYNGSDLAKRHPEWILTDKAGKKLYIPWGCANGHCPQYAADISDPAYRSWWIASAASLLKAGYKGLWIDDVNLELRVSDAYGNQVMPFDSNTGMTMTAANWRRYMAEFMEQVRAALPAYEILHNSIWFASPTGYSDPYVQRQIKAADYINLERGISDPGVTGMSGKFSVSDFLSYVDLAHSYGKNVVFDELRRNGDYGLAGFFLINDGDDAIGDHTVTPNNWWTGYEVNLGTPLAGRYVWNKLLRRDFTQGMVLLNPPNTSTITVALPAPMTKLSTGSSVSTVTLNPGQAVILTGGFSLPDFTFSATPASQTLAAGSVASYPASVGPLSGFVGNVTFGVTGLPFGASASFSPTTISRSGQSVLKVTTSNVTPAGAHALTITASSGSMKHTATVILSVKVASGAGTAVPLASAYNRTGMVTDGVHIADGGLDTYGFAYSANLLGKSWTLNGTTYNFAAANTKNAVTSQTVSMTPGKYIALNLLATGVSGSQTAQPFTVHYTDGSSSVFTQSLSDWANPQNFAGENKAIIMPYRINGGGIKDKRNFTLYRYSFALDINRTVASITLPNNGHVIVLSFAFSVPVPVKLAGSAQSLMEPRPQAAACVLTVSLTRPPCSRQRGPGTSFHLPLDGPIRPAL